VTALSDNWKGPPADSSGVVRWKNGRMWMIGVSIEMARLQLEWSRTTGTLEHCKSRHAANTLLTYKL